MWSTGECQHGPLSDPPTLGDGTVVPYFCADDADFEALQKIVLDETWMKSLGSFMSAQGTVSFYTCTYTYSSMCIYGIYCSSPIHMHLFIAHLCNVYTLFIAHHQTHRFPGVLPQCDAWICYQKNFLQVHVVYIYM